MAASKKMVIEELDRFGTAAATEIAPRRRARCLLLLPTLSRAEVAAVARGEMSLDARTRAYIRGRLTFVVLRPHAISH